MEKTYNENPGMYEKNDHYVVDASPILSNGKTVCAAKDQATGKVVISNNSESNTTYPNEND